MKHLKNILFVIVLVLIDQVSKLYFFEKQIYFFKYFSFNFVANTGIIFGFFKGFNLILIFVSIFVIGLIFYYYKKYKGYSLAFNLILAGAFGNLIDRIFRGYVIDFINLKIWPVFNLADSFITIGILLLIYFIWKEKD